LITITFQYVFVGFASKFLLCVYTIEVISVEIIENKKGIAQQTIPFLKPYLTFNHYSMKKLSLLIHTTLQFLV